MSFSRLGSPIHLLTCILLLPTVIGVDPLFRSCTRNENYTVDDPFQTSLKRLLGFFYYQAPATGFALGSLGVDQGDRPYGLALCRGDVSSWYCRICVANAGREIGKRCPYSREASVWYDNCLLKYSKEAFLGRVDNQNKFYLWNVQNVSDPVTFNKGVKQLLSQLAYDASSTKKMYAAGDSALNGSLKIYGTAQCTRDLSIVDCKKCLDGLVGDLPSCCDGKAGGRVVGGSCNIRYETYPFVNVHS